MITKTIKRALLNTLAASSWGKELIWNLGRDYHAGGTLDDALATANTLFSERGMQSTLDVLGEQATTEQQAAVYRTTYLAAITRIDDEDQADRISISLKPTAICAVNSDGTQLLDEESLQENLEDIVRYAEERGIRVTLDMEDHHWTHVSLEAAQHIWHQGYSNFGIVLQSRLHRTREDIERIFQNGQYTTEKRDMRVRACIGIYEEEKEIAYDRKTAKKELVKRIGELFDAGVFVEIATHDRRVIDEVRELIAQKGIPKERYEFQFLKGVQGAYDLASQLREEEITTRCYVPFELKKGDGVPYMVRRLVNNNRFLWYAAKNKGLQLARVFYRRKA